MSVAVDKILFAETPNICQPMTASVTKLVGTNSNFLFFLLYGTPANSAESQLLEALPASHYGHLRESAD